MAEQAARLCKADLVTEMVGEFPELQGVMGGYYARAEGLDVQVADAIRDHYKPIGQGDEVPTAPVTVAVSLADKLDTLFGFFAIQEIPTGSRDPFALRRAALGVLAIIDTNGVHQSITRAYRRNYLHWLEAVAERWGRTDRVILNEEDFHPLDFPSAREKLEAEIPGLAHHEAQAGWFAESSLRNEFADFHLLDFFADRLKVQQREAGVRHDLIDAVFALGGEDDLVRLLARVHALQAFVGTADGVNLLAGYKRAANILKKEGYSTQSVTPAEAGVHRASGADGEMDSGLRRNDDLGRAKANLLSYTPEPAERALIEALDAAEPKARDAVGAEDFAGAMGALASLRGPIDAFFDAVTVNDVDPAKRAARLALLARLRGAVHQVADFSKIEG